VDKRFLRILRLKLVVTALILSVLPLLVLGFTYYRQFNQAARDNAIEALTRLAQNRRDVLQRFLDDRIAQLNSITQTQPLQRIRDESQLANLFNMLQLQSNVFLALDVIDQKGDRLAHVGTQASPNDPLNYTNEAWFHLAMSSGVYISDVFLGFANVPQLLISVTKWDENGNWILRAAIRTDIIDEIVRSGPGGNRGDAFIVNADNVLHTNSFSGKIFGHLTLPDFSSSTGVKSQEMTEQGQEYLFATAKLTNPKWVLVIRQDLPEAIGSLFKGSNMQIPIFISISLLIVISAILISVYITNDVARVLQEASKIQDPIIQSSKMAALGKMAAGIAHEINNPLAIIGEKAGWMKDLLDEEDVSKSENFRELQECVNKIRDQIDRCRTVTHHLLQFGRRIAPIQESVDINQILADTIILFKSEASFRGIEINTKYEELLPRITTDPTQLQQVFLNIIDNSIDAIGKSGTIGIKTSVTSGANSEIMIEISDNGPGIPKHLLGRIFDPFVTTKKSDEGTGLGLSISYGIVEKLGGHIEVASEESNGATFIIRLPVV
jgi:two-component system, NtrC family, sensor kinase